MFLFDFFTTLQYQNYLIMKNIIILAPLALIAAGCLPAEDRSNHNNPPVADIPGKAFTVTVCDRQSGIDPDSTYFFYGTLTRNADDGVVNFTEGTCTGSDYRFKVTPDPVKLIQTAYNEITFETSEDVNASSSDKCIDVKKIDARHFRLVCHQITGSQNSIDEGTAQVRFWNGSGSGEKSISINVDARSSVKCEGFEFRLDGEQFLLKEIPFEEFKNVVFGDWSKWPQYQHKTQMRFAGKENPDRSKTGYEAIDAMYKTSNGYCLELVGTVPRNATPDNRVRRLMDVVSMRDGQINKKFDDGYAPFIIWNEKNYKGFRWLPKDDSPEEKVIAKSATTQFYPADLRYRKAWIWNRVYKDEESLSYSQKQYFCFIFYEGDRERDFIGCIKEK